MADQRVNPYESPQDSGGAVDQRRKSVVTVRLRNFVGLAVAGYVVVIAIALGIRWAAETDQALDWALYAVGLLGSVLFATSEAFNLRPLESGGVGFRIAATLGVLIANLFLSGLISQGVGWDSQTYQHDPFSLHRSVLEIGVFAVLIATASGAWRAIDRQTKNPRRVNRRGL